MKLFTVESLIWYQALTLKKQNLEFFKLRLITMWIVVNLARRQKQCASFTVTYKSTYQEYKINIAIQMVLLQYQMCKLA